MYMFGCVPNMLFLKELKVIQATDNDMKENNLITDMGSSIVHIWLCTPNMLFLKELT